jgi:hypothetical protein
LSIQRELTSENSWGAVELALPKFIAQHHAQTARSTPGLLVFRLKDLAKGGFDTKRREEISCDPLSTKILHLCPIGERKISVSITRQLGETVIARSHIQEFRK